MKILITGGGGKIGSALAQALAPKHELTLLDARPITGVATTGNACRLVHGELEDETVCRQAVEGVEAIAHLAANLSAEIPRTYERNTIGTWKLLEAAHRAGVERVIFASSINVWGQGRYKIGRRPHVPPYLPIDENCPPRPEDAYGLSKFACEEALRAFSDAYGIKAYCFRLAGVWLPERTTLREPSPLEQIPPLTPLSVIDPWHYIDLRDVVSAFRLALEAPRLPEFGVSYLLADDTSRLEPTRELFERLLPEWLPLGADRLEGHAAWFSNQRAKHDLGWQPQYSWRK